MSFSRLSEGDQKRFEGHVVMLKQLVDESLKGKSSEALTGAVESMNVFEVMMRIVRQEVESELMRRSTEADL